MKKYNKPSTTIVEIETIDMIATSVPADSNGNNAAGTGQAKQNTFDLWDDEE